MSIVSATAYAQDIPTTEPEFTSLVAERLRKEVGDFPVTVKAPLTLSVGDIQANLDRIFAFCKSNAQGCMVEVDRYVKGAAQVVRDNNAPVDRAAVRLVVRGSEYLKRAQASLGPNAASLQTKPLVEGLVILPVLDTPRAIRMLSEKDSKSLNVSGDELFALGRANLEATLKPLLVVAKPAGPGQIGQIVGNVFDTSRVVLLSQWAQLAQAQGGTLVVALPATDAVLYISETTPIAIDALRTLTRNVASKAPNPLSDVLLKWSTNGWELVR